MRKHILTLMLVMLSVVAFGQQWVVIKSDNPSTIQTTLVSSSESQITVNLQVPGFYTFEVTTPRGEANLISVPRTVSTAAAGEPDLPMIAVPAIVGDRQHYSIRVVDAQYADYPMEVAPSKGDFLRTINPEDVPYTYGEAYSTDAFFPAQNVGLYEPYFLRDFRGQNMVVYPFAYNPVSKTLRVYYNMTVEMYSDGISNENVLDRRSNVVKMDPEIEALYGNHFINFNEGLTKYTPIVETGELLIICHDAFMTAMQPFVNWKKQIGRPTTMVSTSTTGTTDTSIKAYIQNQYDANSNLTHVLLVGDVTQIPGHNYSSGSYGGKSDNWYGQVAGNDSYNDIIVGRFSAENETHVTTQVNKVIHYERDINATDTWLNIGQGIAKHDGPGHFGEYDDEHIDYIRNDLLAYNYTNIHRDYNGVSGVSSSASIISQHINEGVSIINYCNQGFETGWDVFNYNNAYVNALTNDNKLPIVWSVAPLNGKYDYNGTCFAETWLRATNNSNGTPTGAIGGMFSYISQPWNPPMYGQDEMADVLVENYATNIKRTLGGCSFDGNMKILDQYGQGAGQGHGTYMSWILYGDPTLTLRNAVPANMNVTHASTMNSTATSFTVNATNGNGALATLTLNNEIMGSATINNGTANITFTAPGTTGTATLTVFGYNKITYIGSVTITQGGTTQYTVNVSANPHEGGNVTGGGTYNQGQSCTVTASPSIGYTFVNWTENGNVVSSQANYTFTVNGNRNLVANFQSMPQNYTISVTANPTNGGTVSGGGAFYYGESCTVIASPNTGFNFINWTENGNPVSNQSSYTFSVSSDRNLVANFTNQNYIITAMAIPTDGGTVSGAGGYNYGQSCTLTAESATGYTFVNWIKDGTQVTTNPSYTFTVTESALYEAHFQLQSFIINASAEPSNGGSVTGGGTFYHGQTCTLTATPAPNYTFINWTKEGNPISEQQSYSFIVTESASYSAHFIQDIVNYTITVRAEPNIGGTVDGGGTFAYGDICTLKAEPIENFEFVNWTENGEQVTTDYVYSFPVTDDAEFVAHFRQNNANSYVIDVSVEPSEGGAVSGGGTYLENTTCTLTAFPNEGYTFEKWNIVGNQFSINTNPYTFTVAGDATYVAHFTQDTNLFTITAMADPIEGGTVSGCGTYEVGTTCTIKAVPSDGYEFSKWTLNGSQVSTNESFEFTVTGNAVYVAHFTKVVNHFAITASVEPAEAGSVIGAGLFEEGISCTLIAMPNPTYSFVSWTENGIVVSTDNQYSFVVDRERNLVAVFLQGLFYTISASTEPNGTISPEGEVIVMPDEDKTFAMIPNSGYCVSKVLVDDMDIGSVESYTFRNVNANHSIHVQFSGLGLEDNIGLELKIYPNPANDKIHIESPNMKRVSIFNLFGIQIESKEVNDDYTFINTNEFSQGTYILKMENKDGRIGYSRFVVGK